MRPHRVRHLHPDRGREVDAVPPNPGGRELRTPAVPRLRLHRHRGARLHRRLLRMLRGHAGEQVYARGGEYSVFSLSRTS
ncbi:hypothetical protein AVEN_85448-1, partial [Araneus ventricosus]